MGNTTSTPPCGKCYELEENVHGYTNVIKKKNDTILALNRQISKMIDDISEIEKSIETSNKQQHIKNKRVKYILESIEALVYTKPIEHANSIFELSNSSVLDDEFEKKIYETASKYFLMKLERILNEMSQMTS